MPVSITMKDTTDPLIYATATAAEIVQGGFLRLYKQSESGPDVVVGAVAAGLWVNYAVLDKLPEPINSNPPPMPEEPAPETPVEETSA